MALVKIRRYNFDRAGKAFLHLRKTHSNIFLTLTDLRFNVVQCKTSGSLVLLELKGVKNHH